MFAWRSRPLAKKRLTAVSAHDRTNTIMIGGGTNRPTTVISQSFLGTQSIETDSATHHMRRINTQFAKL